MVDYSDDEIHDLIHESLHEIEFTGINGFTKFDEFGDPSAKIAIQQQRGILS